MKSNTIKKKCQSGVINCDVPCFDKAWNELVLKNKNRLEGMRDLISIYKKILNKISNNTLVIEDEDGRSVIL